MNCGAVCRTAPFEALHLTGRTWAPSCQSPVSRTRSVSPSRCSARCRSLQRQRDDIGLGADTLRALDGEPAYRAEIRRDVLDERLVDDDHRKIAIPVLFFGIFFKELEVFGGVGLLCSTEGRSCRDGSRCRCRAYLPCLRT